MNLFTRKMRLLTAVVLDEDKEKVVKNLLSYGVMDFIHIEGLDPDQMKKIHKDEGSGSTSELSEYRIRIEIEGKVPSSIKAKAETLILD